ncbi:MAG: hypothetical protein ACLQNE_05010, partial [Thermoguttaceae bacterium]
MRLHLAEFTQAEIADKLGVHPSVVCRDLEWIRDSICPRESPDVQEAFYVQMAKLDQLEHSYWVGWEESKLEKETRTAQRSKPEGRETVALKRERQAGNPALLMGVFRCIAKRDAMLGLTQKSGKSAAAGPPKKRMPSKAEVEQSLRMMSATVAGPSCLLPGDPFYSPNPWSVNEEGRWVDSAGMIFAPGPGQFDPCHPPLAGTSSPEEAAASWKDRKIYDPRVDGYGPQ